MNLVKVGGGELHFYKYIGFISIAFLFLKLEIFKVLRTNSTSMKWPFLCFFVP